MSPDDSDQDELPDETAEEQRILIHSIVKMIERDFRPETWQAFYMMKVEGIPAKEVGEKLGMSTVAVRQANYRIMKRIHEEFGEVTE